MSSAIRISLLILQGVQVSFLLLHDYVPLGRWNNLEAVRRSDSPGALLKTTLLSATPFVLVFAVSCVYWKAWPKWLDMWLWYSYVILLVGAVMAWWGPYLLWSSPERAERYRVRFAGTIKFLPERHGIRPDALHVLFHLCVVSTLILLAKL